MEPIFDKTNIDTRYAKVFIKKDIETLVDSIIIDEILKRKFGIKITCGNYPEELETIKSFAATFPYEVSYKLIIFKEIIVKDLPEIITTENLASEIKNIFYKIIINENDIIESMADDVFDKNQDRYQAYCEHLIKHYMPHFNMNCTIQNRMKII